MMVSKPRHRSCSVKIADIVKYSSLSLFSFSATQMRNDVELSMDLHATTVVITAMMKVLENDFAMFPLGDILNQDCWFAKIPAPKLDEFGFRNAGVERSAGISELAASVSKMNLNIKCISCTSPDLKSFSTEESQDLGAVMNRVLDYVTNMLGGKFLQLQVDRALNNAAKRCPHSPGYDPSFIMPQYATYESTHEPSVTFLLMILLVTAVLIAIIVLIVLSVRCFVRARHSRLLRSLLDSELYLLQREQKQEDKRERELNAVTHSLFQSSGTIPAYVRFLMPVVILVNIGFFLSGHLSLGATVIIEAQLAGEIFQVGDFFSFSMVQSTIDIWNAGGKALAALIFIFSGLWPYTKSIATLVLWFTSPSRVCMATRGSTLLWLDTLAKWSMVDIFVLLVSIAGFRYVRTLLCFSIHRYFLFFLSNTFDRLLFSQNLHCEPPSRFLARQFLLCRSSRGAHVGALRKYDRSTYLSDQLPRYYSLPPAGGKEGFPRSSRTSYGCTVPGNWRSTKHI